jgi:hypothetical protein
LSAVSPATTYEPCSWIPCHAALLEQEEDAHKIDATLEKDDEDDENEGSEQNNKSDDDDDDDDDCQVDDSKRVPTIQLKVGIGKVDENPIISFLASDDEDDADDGDDDEGEDADGDGVVSTEEDDAAADDEDVGQGTDSNVAVEPILSIKRKLVSGLRREDPPKSKRPLIQEM